MQADTQTRGDRGRVGAARGFSDDEWECIKRTMRRYDVVRRFLAAGPRVVLGCFSREPVAITAVLRVLWQRRRMARALRRRGLPAWVTSDVKGR